MYSEENSYAFASGVIMSVLPLHIGSPLVLNEMSSRGMFPRGGSLNMLLGTFGFYSCILCCTINNWEAGPHVLHSCF